MVVLLFIVLVIASHGTYFIWNFTTRIGQVFGFVENWKAYWMIREMKTENKQFKFICQYIHKSLGTCPVCNMQRFNELYFTCFFFMSELKTYQLPLLTYIIGLIIFSGFNFSIYQFINVLTEKKKEPQKEIITQKIKLTDHAN